MTTTKEPANGRGQISALAYDNWLRRHNGNEIQDWLEAEAEILQRHDGHVQFIEGNNTQSSLLLQQGENRVARKIQQRLLPKKMPAWNGFAISGKSIPAQAVGGDCFDFFPLLMDDSERLGVMVADASGHRAISGHRLLTNGETLSMECRPGRRRRLVAVVRLRILRSRLP